MWLTILLLFIAISLGLVLSDIFTASYHGRFDTVKDFIMEKGIDVNLNSAKTGGTALMDASINGHKDVVELLLKHGAKVDTATKDGFTALMDASLMGHVTVVQMLLKAGANVNAQSNLGQNASKDISK
jgi:ankyrin repeat protein